jgi:hypothetical protein
MNGITTSLVLLPPMVIIYTNLLRGLDLDMDGLSGYFLYTDVVGCYEVGLAHLLLMELWIPLTNILLNKITGRSIPSHFSASVAWIRTLFHVKMKKW